MAGSPIKRARKAKAKVFFDREEALYEIALFLHDGGSLIAFCRGLDLNYPTVVNWLNDDPERKAVFEKAMEGREFQLRESVRELLARAVRTNLHTALTNRYRLKNLSSLPDDVKNMITGVTFQDGKVKDVKFQDQLRAAELLGKSLKMFTDKHEHEVGESLADLLALSNRPEKAQ